MTNVRKQTEKRSSLDVKLKSRLKANKMKQKYNTTPGEEKHSIHDNCGNGKNDNLIKTRLVNTTLSQTNGKYMERSKQQWCQQHCIDMKASWLLLMMLFVCSGMECWSFSHNTTPLTKSDNHEPFLENTSRLMPLTSDTQRTTNKWQRRHNNNSSNNQTFAPATNATHHLHLTSPDSVARGGDSIFMRFAKHFPSGNELWDGIVRDCYYKPSFSCLQKNVHTYLSDVLEAQDLNVTHRLKFYRNANDYTATESKQPATEAAAAKDFQDSDEVSNDIADDDNEDKNGNTFHTHNKPHAGAVFSDITYTPIEEVTNSLYGKSVKFALTHDIELKLPEILFDGATFRVSPRSIEGNGIIAKLELIPKQEIEARLAGKILMKKIQQFLKSKVLLAFLALILIVKVIKVKLFWLLPFIIGVSAAKKLLLKFLLFLFPALSHLFKLCSYYQQTYHHTTKYHHHHHLIDHHHTILPTDHNSIPELIYTHPPKGHISTYLHGAPIHEKHNHPLHEPYDSGWESSGPGLGSEYISDINRVAQVDENSVYFQPHSNNDANELHDWGLGTTHANLDKQQQQQQQKQKQSVKRNEQHIITQQHRPPVSGILHKPPPPPSPAQPQNYQKPQVTSQTFNPFIQTDNLLNKSSAYNNKQKNIVIGSQSVVSPVYAAGVRQKHHHKTYVHGGGDGIGAPPPLTVSAQIAAQYDPTRNVPQQHTQLQLTPEMQAQLKEALRIQNEQRIVQQQQKILDQQPFAMDGQPIMPLNYDPFYTPILMKIDKIIEPLGVTDEFCKERLVCSMYKDPNRYTPHSNFVSVELSRDANELPSISNTNAAMTRFFRLIQAARDGQDKKNCLLLYPKCNINTE